MTSWGYLRYRLAMKIKDGREQISARLNPETVAAIDERRRPQGITRDEWLQRAADFCLSLPVKNPTP